MSSSALRTVLAFTMLVSIGCMSASGGTRAATPALPVVTVEPAQSDVALVNPAGVPQVSGSLRTLHALQFMDVRVGTGAPLLPRQCIYAHYTGWLPDGTKFDSSRDTTRSGEPRSPIAFPQGARRVIAGWDAGFEGMLVGGARRLVIPFPMGYGEAGSPPTIPPRSTLIFDIELLAARDTLARGADEAPRNAPPLCAPWSDVAPTLAPPTGVVPPLN
jgi:peptidylprolyl isomerase